MGLPESVEAKVQRITLDPLIGARNARGTFAEVRITQSLKNPNGTCVAIGPSQPSDLVEGVPFEAWGGYDGATKQLFKGLFTGLAWDYFPLGLGFDTRDIYARMLKPWGGEAREYTEQEDGAIIINLLEANGIMEHDIESSGWLMGTVTPVVLEPGQTPHSLVEEINKAAGYRTWCRADGVVVRRKVSGAPGLSAGYAFQQGVNISKIKRNRSTDGIVNRVVVIGYEYEGVEVRAEAFAINPYLDAEVAPELRPRYVTLEYQSDLIETEEKAAAVAQRMVADLNRRPEYLQLEVPGNPFVQPGMTISVTHEITDGFVLAVVETVTHVIRANSWVTTIQTDGGTLSGYNASAPVPNIDVKIYKEHEDTGSGLEARLFVVCDSSASFDPDGPEDALVRLWTASVDAGTVTIVGFNNAPVLNLIISGPATTLTVGLTLTDAQGLTASTTRVIALDNAATINYEPLYAACGTFVTCSLDGEATWNDQPVPGGALATCLAAKGPSWGMVFGADNGHVYLDRDNLVSPLLDTGQPAAGHGAVTALYVHELDDARIWVGHADGTIAYGEINLDTNVIAWTVRGTVGAGPVTDLAESYFAFEEVRIESDNIAAISRDGGQTSETLFTGDTTSRMTAGWERQFYGFTNDPDPLREENGNDIAFGSPVPPFTHLQAQAMGHKRREWYGVDDQARLWLSLDLETAAHVGTAPTGIYHEERSPRIDGVIYMAGGDGVLPGGGILKSIRHFGTPIYVRRLPGTQRAYMVGYGVGQAATPPPVQALILRPTRGLSPGGVWVRDLTTGAWTLKNTGLPSGIHWFHIAASPINPLRLLLVGNSIPSYVNWQISGGAVKMDDGVTSPLFLSDDGGDTWAPATLSAAGITYPRRIVGGEWSKSSADRYSIAGLFNIDPPPFPPSYPGAWKQDMDAGSSVPVFNPVAAWEGDGWPYLAAGSDGDTVIEGNGTAGYIPGAAASLTQVSLQTPTEPTPFGYMDTLPAGSLAAVLVDQFGDVWTSINYRSAPFVARTSGPLNTLNTAYFGITQDAVLYAAVSGGTYRRIPDIFGAGSSTDVGPGGGGTTGYVRVDRQQRRVIAACKGNDSPAIDYMDGSGAWSTLDGPPGVTAGDLANVVEVINV